MASTNSVRLGPSIRMIEAQFKDLESRLMRQEEKAGREEFRSLLLQAELDLHKDALREQALELQKKDRIIDDQLTQLIQAWSNDAQVTGRPMNREQDPENNRNWGKSSKKRNFEQYST
ncbi:unnamed protein product [Clonostachys chloroleuca]|uniref:Uncharacterized protein n=1 Tax=Clonostachys chloroleuca TaxID=1926264 RepID=A0AA35QFA9_9HYPO|nr:unnamed protein product [Clonostachys chloroleuca]